MSKIEQRVGNVSSLVRKGKEATQGNGKTGKRKEKERIEMDEI